MQKKVPLLITSGLCAHSNSLQTYVFKLKRTNFVEKNLTNLFYESYLKGFEATTTKCTRYQLRQ